MPLPNTSLPGLLVVNDGDDRRIELVAVLASKGYSVEGSDLASVARLISVRELLAELVILEIGQSGRLDLKLVEHLRNAYPRIGIIVVSSLLRSEDRLWAYRSGADIYLQTKTGDTQESEVIIAAVNALADRLFKEHSMTSSIVLDVRTLQLHGPNATVDISDQESQLLSAFVDTSDRRLETQRLIEITAKSGIEASKSTLEVQLVRLRKKLATVGAESPTIKALRGVGYQLCVPVIVMRSDT